MTPQEIDSHWDFQRPDVSEGRFRKLLEQPDLTPQERAQVLTQIARTQGMQRRFEDARATLADAQALNPDGLGEVRIALERGRLFNSSGDPEKARPCFEQARRLAQELGEEFYAIDAAHMIANVAKGDQAIQWNRRAIAAAEQARDERARNWQGSLLNNLGWSLHAQGDYSGALECFEKALAFRVVQGKERGVMIARWCVARALRSLGRVDEALNRQQALAAEIIAAGTAQDGFVSEELGECLLALGRSEEARPHFAEAHRLLSADPWLATNEPARLARLLDLANGGE